MMTERQADRGAYEAYVAALSSDNSAFRAAFREAFFQALQEQMTPRQYEVLLLREVEGLSGKEIAGKLGISQSAVSRHLTRGKKRLRTLLAYNLELRGGRYSREADSHPARTAAGREAQRRRAGHCGRAGRPAGKGFPAGRFCAGGAALCQIRGQRRANLWLLLQYISEKGGLRLKSACRGVKLKAVKNSVIVAYL